jgi:cytosine/adenosine deaminase-related metal-dependent hydrolase
MKLPRIEATSFTPLIAYDEEARILTMRGVSIPEDTPSFYKPVFEFLDEYLQYGNAPLNISIELVHFNSSSSKALFDAFKKISKINQNQGVRIAWHCDEDDDDMIEIIEDYEDILDLEIETVKISGIE